MPTDSGLRAVPGNGHAAAVIFVGELENQKAGHDLIQIETRETPLKKVLTGNAFESRGSHGEIALR
jgi:hypothetical protein